MDEKPSFYVGKMDIIIEKGVGKMKNSYFCCWKNGLKYAYTKD